MDSLDDEFVSYWNDLHDELARRLPSLTLRFFRDLSPRDANAIAALVDGGKKLRGVVVLAVCHALGGNVERALTGAAAIECVHAASLIHDDLVDGDHVRRDRPATWIVQGSRRAVLLADVILATAVQRSAELGKAQVATLARAIAMLAAGAYGEPFALSDVDADDGGELYERTIRLKTGSLFSAAAELGAVSATSKRMLRAAASDFGARIGEAYQIADDLHDTVRADHAATPQRLATLAALRACFDRAAASNGLEPDGARIARAMEVAIERRLALARDALAPFPATPRLGSLRRVPRAIVQTMAAAPARVRSHALAGAAPTT